MFRFIFVIIFLLSSLNAYSVTECNEKIINYFIGTEGLNGQQAHLWVNFEGGGSASVSSESAAFDSMLSTVMLSVASEKTVKVRYLADGVNCKIHHPDWVGLWLLQ